MSRIKGKYVAQITINWDRERNSDMIPIEEIKENLKKFSDYIKEELVLSAETNMVEVNEQHCEIEEVDE